MGVENGMVVGAAAEWERLNRPAPSCMATVEEFEKFAWDAGRIKEIMVRSFDLWDDDLTEEVAEAIWSGLPSEFTHGLVSGWMQLDSTREDYDEWVERRN